MRDRPAAQGLYQRRLLGEQGSVRATKTALAVLSAYRDRALAWMQQYGLWGRRNDAHEAAVPLRRRHGLAGIGWVRMLALLL